ncbi:MAG TPA: hypothetical protein VFV01_19995 [Spirillospora sp.]|nr:hypothetical protein [Spirillospora sp.]
MTKSAILLGVLTVLALVFASAWTSPAAPAQTQRHDVADAVVVKPGPVKLNAKRAQPRDSVLDTGTPLSCVRVTVTNQSGDDVDVNPLYFSITDTGNTKHDAGSALGEYDGEVAATTLAPHENAKGLVCAEGHFQPKVVAMTDALFSEIARADVH